MSKSCTRRNGIVGGSGITASHRVWLREGTLPPLEHRVRQSAVPILPPPGALALTICQIDASPTSMPLCNMCEAASSNVLPRHSTAAITGRYDASSKRFVTRGSNCNLRFNTSQRLSTESSRRLSTSKLDRPHGPDRGLCEGRVTQRTLVLARASTAIGGAAAFKAMLKPTTKTMRDHGHRYSALLLVRSFS